MASAEEQEIPWVNLGEPLQIYFGMNVRSATISTQATPYYQQLSMKQRVRCGENSDGLET